MSSLNFHPGQVNALIATVPREGSRAAPADVIDHQRWWGRHGATQATAEQPTSAHQTATDRASGGQGRARQLGILIDVMAAAWGVAVVLFATGTEDHRHVLVFASLLILWPLFLRRAQGTHNLLDSARVPWGPFLTAALHAGAMLGLAVWVLHAPTPPGLLVAAVLSVAATSALARCMWRQLRPPRRVLLIGHRADAARFDAEVVKRLGNHVSIVARLSPEIGTTSAAAEHVRAHDPDDVVVLRHALSAADLRGLSRAMEPHRSLHVATDLGHLGAQRVRVRSGGGMSLLSIGPSQRHGTSLALCSALGKLWAGLVLLIALPVLAVVALAVRLESPGPALFRQVRIGRDGQPFVMFKFRTMATCVTHPDESANDVEGGVLFKARCDPRVTRLGRVLRRYSVDEIPQLWNVLRGEMALIGPRPALPEEVKRYHEEACHRLAVRPGLTGLWQVSGRCDLTWAETVRLDLSYVDNWTPLLDLRILLRTVPAVLGHRGAY